MTSRTNAAILIAAGVMLALAAAGAWQLMGGASLRAQQPPTADNDGHAGHDHHGADHGDGHDNASRRPGRDDHGADGHDEADSHGPSDPHGDEEHAGGDHADEAPRVTLDARQTETFGIRLATATGGSLSRRIRLPGEIVLNADRSAHVVPPAGGVVRSVAASVGDRVRAGDVLAVLESAGLSEAKADYLAKLNEVNCCRIELDRAEALYATTGRLLAFLDADPTLDALREAKFGELGEAHGKLLGAYAELVFSRAAYEREKKLLAERVTSRADFQAAENAYKKASAVYLAARSALAYESRRAALEARRARQDSELAARAAERKLHVLGLTEREVAALQNALAVANARECSDPNCAACQAARAPAEEPAGDGGDAHGPEGHGGQDACEHCLEEGLGTYALRAPFEGVVVEKHLALGEKVGEGESVYTIADLGTVWVDLSVFQKDLPYVAAGQSARILAGPGVPEARGKVAYVSPVVDVASRTAVARLVLPNVDGRLRPGLYVTAELSGPARRAEVLVEAEAVQQLGEQDVVFVPAGGGFEARPVVVGRRDEGKVEILSGLAAGAQYVAGGAFELKAKLVTSGLGAHAGHGH